MDSTLMASRRPRLTSRGVSIALRRGTPGTSNPRPPVGTGTRRKRQTRTRRVDAAVHQGVELGRRGGLLLLERDDLVGQAVEFHLGPQDVLLCDAPRAVARGGHVPDPAEQRLALAVDLDGDFGQVAVERLQHADDGAD